eukprot:CAMPEP_0194209684 /NCGR_PEP_ID=MMETSP0156-20130528/7721_1 /TAXON_ID=33649 /ORGANISM="Thalassionema nitzschioides, Strain L26-B" /LENGTH=66 /DNA_ID=CAMNT_0038936889 /DNA_START=59 /DNA_END=259 /DNA_ORIENTATION=+
MGCAHSAEVTIDPKGREPTIYQTPSSRTYIFDEQAEIPDNYFTPEIQVLDSITIGTIHTASNQWSN